MELSSPMSLGTQCKFVIISQIQRVVKLFHISDAVGTMILYNLS